MSNTSGRLGNPGFRPGAARLGVGSVSATLNVSATNTITLGHATGLNRIALSTATNTITLNTSEVRSLNTKVVNVSASDVVTLNTSNVRNAVSGGPQTINVSASSRIALTEAASVGSGRIVFGSGTNALAFQASNANGGHHSYLSVSASTAIRFQASYATEYVSPIHVTATTTLALVNEPAASQVRHVCVSASDTLEFNPQADSDGQIRIVSVSAADQIQLSDDAEAGQIRHVSASAGNVMSFRGTLSAEGPRTVSAITSVLFHSSAGSQHTVIASAGNTLSFQAQAFSGGRVIGVSAVTSMGLAGPSRSSQIIDPECLATIHFVGAASGVIAQNVGVNTLTFLDLATASVQLASGGSVPGGDANAGLRSVAYPSVSGTFPFSYAETPAGLLLIANGVDPMLRWDGLSGTADTAGVQPPSAACLLAGQDVGTLIGMRWAYVRFVDDNGNYSALSPYSNAVNLGRDALIENVTYNPTTGVVTITSTGHGLGPSDDVVIQDVQGLSINGTQAITTVNENSFTINALSITSGNWLGGGSWTWGCNQVVYSQLPVSLETKVVRRQILRNLNGTADVFYVDIDTTDLISSQLISTNTDEALSAGEAVPLFTSNELPYACRYLPPPNHKSIVASYSGRIFACGEVAVTIGNVVPVFGSSTVQGVGTSWPATLAGRFLYVTGARNSCEILSVDVATQTLTLLNAYGDSTQPYATYAIRPAPGERRLVYYTEPGLPEAWPPWNSFAIPEEDDEIVGMMFRTGFLYFVEQRHIHRFTMQDEPSEGSTFASVNRGCINGRCLVQIENTSYLLDEAGIHAFDGGQATEPISQPIQSIFQADGLLGGLMVDWTADTTLWHAVHDPVRNTVRWFVQMVNYDAIYHAICYDYRQSRWWIEQYPSRVTSSTTGVVGYRRSLVGTDARRVVVLGEGALDYVADASFSPTGTVTSSDSTSLTDANASFPASVEGAPVSIVGGTGRGQQSIIASNTSTMLEVVQPWQTPLDFTSTYQIGGVGWTWQSGWFEIAVEGEEENARDAMITYQPTVQPAAIDMQLFYDHSADPRAWAMAIEQDGVSVVQGDPNITINLQTRQCRSGWSMQRFGGHSEVYGYGEQYVQILLAGVQCSESIRIFQVTMNGVRSGEDQ